MCLEMIYLEHDLVKRSDRNMMNAVESRKSIRRYQQRPIDDEMILQLIESARVAPSGSNTQPWNFIIVKSEETKRKIAKINGAQAWMVDAPVHIVCVADLRVRIKDNMEIYIDEDSPQREVKQIIRDTAIAVEHIVLEAQSLGFGSCWNAAFVQEDIRPILNIPNDKYVVAVITVGYADESPMPRPRKRMEEIIRYEKW